jgi:hypothetical protein
LSPFLVRELHGRVSFRKLVEVEDSDSCLSSDPLCSEDKSHSLSWLWQHSRSRWDSGEGVRELGVWDQPRSSRNSPWLQLATLPPQVTASSVFHAGPLGARKCLKQVLFLRGSGGPGTCISNLLLEDADAATQGPHVE